MGIMRNMKGNNTEDSSDAEKLAKKAAKIAKMAIKATVKAVIGILHFLGPIGIALVCLLSFLVFFSFDEINDQTAKDTEKSVTEALKSVGVEDLISSVDIKGSEGEGYYFDFNDKQLREEITKKLHKNDVSLGDLGMKKIDTLMEFIKAEITTQLPNISQDPENIKTDGDKLQGAIKFKRQTINKAIGQVVGNNVEERNQNYYLTYVSQDTFKGYVDNGKEEALQHFTLDDKRQLITATWSYSDSEGTIIKQDSAKEYRTKVQKYTMPYQYPLAFLLEGQNVKFAEKLAGLAADSDITITLLDNVTMNLVKTIVTEYSQQAVSYTTVDNQTNERQTTERAEGEIIQQGNPTVTETTNENATSELQVTNVDAWCVQYKKEYILEENDTGYISSGVDRQIGDYRGPISTVISFDEQRTVWKNVYSRTIVDTEIQNRNITYKYKENPDVEAKVEGNVDKFVNLMKEYKNSVMHNLQSDKAENLLDILAGSEKTNNMVELTKWLLQQCSKKFKYGLTEFDFSEYEPDSFTQVSLGVYGGTVEEKVWFTLRNAGYSEFSVAGVMGNIYQECRFNPTDIQTGVDNAGWKGIGLIQWTEGRKEGLKAYASSQGKGWEDSDVQIQYLLGELQKGGGADGYATWQWSGFTRYETQWINATTPTDAAIAFCKGFERAGNAMMEVRTSKAEEYYNEFHGKTAPIPGNFDCETVIAAGYVFPHYLQGNYSRAYGSSTISKSGCGPTSLSMILAGIKGDASITPVTLVDNLEKYYPSFHSYYMPGSGSIYEGLCNSNFLSTIYGVKSTYIASPQQGLDAIASGKCAIARVNGHVLAIVPLPDQYKNAGYQFYVMDSGRGLDGPYRSISELNAQPATKGGGFAFKYIIEP